MPKHVTLAKHAVSPKSRTVKLAALRRRSLFHETGGDNVRSLEIPDRSGCGTYRRVRRSQQRPERAEFVFNLRLAQRIEEKLRSEGFLRRGCFDEGKAGPA